MNGLNGTTAQELLEALQKNDFTTVLGHLQNNATIFNPTTRNFFAQEFMAQPVGFNVLNFVQRLQVFIKDELYTHQILQQDAQPLPTSYMEHVGKIDFAMKFVQGGSFLMGNPAEEARPQERPAHKVKVSDFFLAETPVTQALWWEVMGSLPDIDANFLGDKKPIVNVSWEDAHTFIQTLNQKIEQEKGENPNFVLPTEAQWEYAARGETYQSYTKISGTNDRDLYRQYAHYTNYGALDGNLHTVEVDDKEANVLGLYGMSGNVWDWCEDAFKITTYSDYHNRYGNEAYQNLNPCVSETTKNTLHVLRGGAYNSNDSGSVFLWFRQNRDKIYKGNYISFRLCRYA
jgi:formylglycine-generating enzyme required for sulfatase activity